MIYIWEFPLIIDYRRTCEHQIFINLILFDIWHYGAPQEINQSRHIRTSWVNSFGNYFLVNHLFGAVIARRGWLFLSALLGILAIEVFRYCGLCFLTLVFLAFAPLDWIFSCRRRSPDTTFLDGFSVRGRKRIIWPVSLVADLWPTSSRRAATPAPHMPLRSSTKDYGGEPAATPHA